MQSFKLPFRFDTGKLKLDLDSVLPSDWLPHYNADDYEGDWSVASLRSVSGAQDVPYSSTMPDICRDTPLLSRCPYIAELLAQFNCDKTVVRFMRLAAGAVIKEHADSALSLEHGEARLHVPVVTNAGVEFYLNGSRVDMKEGECWYLDFTLPHRIVNGGDTPRTHLVIDCKLNDWLEKILRPPSSAR